MKSELVLLLTLVGVTLFSNNAAIEAAPVHRILSAVPSPAGRAQIKPSSSHHKSPRRHSHKHKSNPINRHTAAIMPKHVPPPSPWFISSDRRAPSPSLLNGHAVVDEDDDDAGNELLDTETDGLARPDDDDTIEGEILEEEGDDDNEITDDGEIENIHIQNPAPQVVFKTEDKWIQENGIQDADFAPESPEDEEEEEEEVKVVEVKKYQPETEDVDEVIEELVVVISSFGGRSAVAELAAEEP